MKELKITKGEWYIKNEENENWKENYFYLYADEKPIATIYGDNAVWLTKEEELANAKAIKEVPSLIECILEAKELMNKAIDSGDWKVDGACDPDYLFGKINRIIDNIIEE